VKTSENKHEISGIVKGSIAEEMELNAGDFLLTINGKKVKDILHYRYLTRGEELLIAIERANGEIWELDIEKDPYEELGLIFVLPNMAEIRKCQNKCIFCFVDQQPKGLRDSLYVKDDDPIESFMRGNYVTLTNLTNDDVKRIAHYHLSPLRISVHTSNLALRSDMMGNNKAGNLFEILDEFSKAHMQMHFQIVACKGYNDGYTLMETTARLSRQPGAASLAIVPAGLTKHREGLRNLEPYGLLDAGLMIMVVNVMQENNIKLHGVPFVYLSDEWYLMAGQELPKYEEYGDFPQLDNGVGLIRLFEREFEDEIQENEPSNLEKVTTIGIVTGTAAADFMRGLAGKFEKNNANVKIFVHVVKNEFFGELITVSGLLTGQDVIGQLKGKVNQDVIFMPENAFRADTEIMLDDVTLDDLAEALGTEVKIGSADGGEFYRQLVGEIKEGITYV